MSTTMKAFWKCMFSPRLIRIYRSTPIEVYVPNSFEKFGDQVIHSLYIIWKIGVYTSPVLIKFLYDREYLSTEYFGSFTRLVTSIGVILIMSYCCRSLGRCANEKYVEFMKVLEAAQLNLNPDVKKQLCTYEFEFHSWPVEFDMHQLSGHHSKAAARSNTTGESSSLMPQTFLQCAAVIPFRIVAYIAIHTFGIRLIYPGTLGILQMVLGETLIQGRARLIEFYKGERYKIKTVDDNALDAMFVDRRPNRTTNGDTLVICCEGNAGFYEIGIMATPLEAGYSVLGWNHPGFGGSTGRPYPPQEQNAMDAIVQFAINKLDFKLENILLFGWSIGGYTSSWAAMHYPDVKGVIVDATFDDILPLAINHMPKCIEPIVRLAIREHANLNVYDQLVKYSGPILLIRRTEDEVICIRENDLSSNRGNYLLIKLLHSRYPSIFREPQIGVLTQYLAVTAAAQDLILQKYGVNEQLCNSLLQSYISEFSKSYPMKIGEEFSEEEKNQMALFLAKKYMKDFKATHCVNLPAEMFQPPWDVSVESDFVFT